MAAFVWFPDQHTYTYLSTLHWWSLLWNSPTAGRRVWSTTRVRLENGVCQWEEQLHARMIE